MAIQRKVQRSIKIAGEIKIDMMMKLTNCTRNRLATAPKINLFCRLWKNKRHSNLLTFHGIHLGLQIILLLKLNWLGSSRRRLDLMEGKEEVEEDSEEKRKVEFEAKHSVICCDVQLFRISHFLQLE